ncbi:MAG: tetratricopeptide repeat protein [Candidatus Marinimicrobia bacterium]|nr:tetratricopeptide repeat protein [Candidatus Neomarinimicrobiota bacterium]
MKLNNSHTHKLLSQYSISRVSLLALLAITLGIQSCAYYNTFYNAEEYFVEAQKLTRENQAEKVSREEINLYSKAIEKSKKLLQRYPESKYRDDAQFLIGKSYYYKGDYTLAKRYFDDLALNYASSPYAREVPLWIGRCLVQLGDLEMARYEASRITKGKASRGLQADALLLMGEIAVKQDSLALAETYLRQVIDRSPDGFTKAQAQFQIGRMRENQVDHEGALQAFRSVAKYRPSESLKVEAIIRQTAMLKALNRDEDAVEMIKEMLLSDKFVEIRGQLEVELGKLYLVIGEEDRAESKLNSILEDYTRKEVAAEADYVLGELYLTRKFDYKAARAAYADIKSQSVRSPFVGKGTQRTKQIDRYEKIQLDHINLQRQLAGLPALVKEKKKSTAKGRGSRSAKSRGRSRNARPGNPDDQEEPASRSKQKTPDEIVAVSYEDSIRIFKSIDENRYSLAEYMLFEFARVDTTIEILSALEVSSSDSTLKHRSAYMQYYALESIKGDPGAGRQVLDRISTSYPDYYATIMDESQAQLPEIDPDQERYLQIAVLFDNGQYAAASQQYLTIREDSTVSRGLRAKSSFNHAWLHDHFLYDRDEALAAYIYVVEHFPDDPLALTAQARLRILKQEAVVAEETVTEVPEDGSGQQDAAEDRQQHKEPKEGDKERELGSKK